MRLITILTVSIAILGVFAESGGRKATRASEHETTNAERFRRGLPPKSPLRRFNTTQPRNLARRSAAATQSVMLVASPDTSVKRSLSKRDTPHDSVSQLYFDGSNALFALSTTTETKLYVVGSGTDQIVQPFFNEAGLQVAIVSQLFTYGTYPDMTPNAAGGPTSVWFTIEYLSEISSDPSQNSGHYEQGPIWTTPATLPGPASIDFFNYDGTVTTNVPFWAFDYNGETFLGAALSGDDFGVGNAYTRVNLQWEVYSET
ncbi:hypothetical protein M231_00362 [Tremella mesenterica]|uniref:Uncharacterized protein n=1 Tax=Tremella mesenterica TaxID=5217 RepID=A0A4Q1BWB4_TREME|nr:uncharacterized protein TREMEDRAFT_63490 [Tremella mesenterica DSM 1558]EIW68317.1 hypothetical protein TREMEDRAFT_63490 [Tremella mesenterica DSM 1558]RXK42372.1 hypothetical protein M231_00362 [Tremella mesenterica]